MMKGVQFFSAEILLRLAFLLIGEGLFLVFTASATGVRISLVSKENAKVEPMVSEKVKVFDGWPAHDRNPCTGRLKKNPTKPFSWKSESRK